MLILAKISDRKAFLDGYSKATAPLVAKYGGRYVMRAPGGKLLEGNWGEGASAVISEWPDEAAIDAFWNSKEYQDAKALRLDNSEVQVVVITAPKFTSD